MGDVLKSNKATTEENMRRRKAGKMEIDIPIEGVVVVQNEHSENDTELDDIPLAKIQRRKEEPEKAKGKGKSGDLFVQGVDAAKRGKAKETLKKKVKEKSKGKVEDTPVAKNTLE